MKYYYLLIALAVLTHPMLFAQTTVVNESLEGHFSPSSDLPAQPDSTKKSPFVISDIVITGNNKTKSYIIERELTFKRGDSTSLTELVKQFELARRLLMNTRLFHEVVVSLKGFRGYLVEVQIDVKERWYIFPIPYVKLVDRNLSEWAKQGYDFQRTNYGAKLSWHNFSGRKDKLKAWFITGYTRQIEFSYEQPYADKSLKKGFGVNLSYATAKEINHTTENNEQQFVPSTKLMNALDSASRSLFYGQVLNEKFSVGFSYSYRPAIRTRHLFRLSFNTNRVDEAVVILNPKYFSNGNHIVSYPEFNYIIEYNNIDYVAYPLKGFIGDASLTRRGVNSVMNFWQLQSKGTWGWPVANKTFFGFQAYGVLTLPFDQPYFNQRLFGYGDMYLRGLENYVIDGVAGGMVRNTFRREMLKFNLPFFQMKSYNKIPFRIYLKTYADMGYAYNKTFPENSLVNRMLYTAGAGLDLVTLYDIVMRFEYSFNQLGENGLFLHFKNEF